MNHAVQLPVWLWLSLLAILLALWWLAATRVRRENGRRGREGRAAEAEAERALVALGYVVEGRQVHQVFHLEVDGEQVAVSCRADLVLRRRRRRYVAEVKTGLDADPTHPDTRRQLLEYLLAFQVDGVLLVDMAGRRVHELQFPALGPGRRS